MFAIVSADPMIDALATLLAVTQNNLVVLTCTSIVFTASWSCLAENIMYAC
jgi:trehalose-6-phosphatase